MLFKSLFFLLLSTNTYLLLRLFLHCQSFLVASDLQYDSRNLRVLPSCNKLESGLRNARIFDRQFCNENVRIFSSSVHLECHRKCHVFRCPSELTPLSLISHWSFITFQKSICAAVNVLTRFDKVRSANFRTLVLRTHFKKSNS